MTQTNRPNTTRRQVINKRPSITVRAGIRTAPPPRYSTDMLKALNRVLGGR